MELRDKIVDFAQWCPKCRHRDLNENQEPCCDCLEEPVNTESRKPVRWKER